MGLGAKVRCRCWEDGLLRSPPPDPAHVRLSDEGWISTDFDWRENGEELENFEHWLSTCCPHEDMVLVSIRISNWAEYRRFQQQLCELGSDQFPTLSAVLPAMNEGHVSAAASAEAIKELEDLGRRDLGSEWVLLDAENDVVLYSYVKSHEGVIIATTDYQAGFDPNGFFVREKAKTVRQYLARSLARYGSKLGQRYQQLQSLMSPPPSAFTMKITPATFLGRVSKWIGGKTRMVEVFRAKRFSQQKIAADRVRLTDQQTGRIFESPIYVSISSTTTHGGGEETTTEVFPIYLAVERRPKPHDTFDYLVDALTTIFRASVETGNPVCWR